jgi:general secretion pathway protein N
VIPALRLNHALGAAAIVFAALAAWPWLVAPIPAVRPPTAPAANGTPPVPAALPPLASYAAIVERPLFSPSRRPPPNAETPAGPSIESRYRLLGMVATGLHKKAFVADGTRKVEIAEGDRLDSWTVTEIGADRVRLTSPTGEMTLRLKPAAVEPPKPQ